MSTKTWLRSILLDALAQRDDRPYWRQAGDSFAPPPGATLCLWQPDGKLGDSVIHTQLVRALRLHRPDVRLYVGCAPGMQALWEKLPGVCGVLDATDWRAAHRAWSAQGAPLDIVVSLEGFLSLNTVRFLRAVRPAVSMGLDVSRYRLFKHTIADHTFAHPRRHITERLRSVCAMLQVPYEDQSDLIDVARHCAPPALPPTTAGPLVLINTYGAGPQKRLSGEVIDWLRGQILARHPDATLMFNVPGQERDAFSAAHTLSANPRQVLTPNNMSLWQLMALVGQCQAVFTPDTGVGHVAAALRVPLTVFFEDAHYTPVVWAPNTPLLNAMLPTLPGQINSFDRECARQALDTLWPASRARAAAQG